MTDTEESGSYRVYIAGPIRTSGNFMANVAEAIEAAEAVHEAGHVPFIPHTHNQQWDLMFPKDRDTWVEMDVQWVDACDALVRLDGESEGADAEVERAIDQGIPVYYGVEDFLGDRYVDTGR